MIRLPAPNFTYESALDSCVDGITGNAELRRKLTKGKADLVSAGAHYEEQAGRGTLFSIAPIGDVVEGTPIVDELTSDELITVYEQYLVGQTKPARRFYDAIKSLAQDDCPFCGISSPGNLDHFLPKKHFPQSSVYPQNLVPACRDCNMGSKAQKFATIAEEQVIHPFSDHARFFNTQWMSAVFHPGQDENSLGRVEYFLNPPEDWDVSDVAKIKRHFQDFNLARRYGTKAAQQLTPVMAQMAAAGSSELGCRIILRPAIDHSPYPNYWQRVMYQALLHHFS